MNFFQKIPIFFFSMLYPMKVYGKENIPEGGAVLVSNHFRAIDCGFIARICDKDIKYLAKKEIFKNKLISKIVKSYGAIPIDRDNPDMKSLLEAIKEIKKGNKSIKPYLSSIHTAPSLNFSDKISLIVTPRRTT